jgi:hypothetical protein
MTKSQIFKLAHKKAKEIAAVVGDYQIAFTLSLKEVYKMAKSKGSKFLVLDDNREILGVYPSITKAVKAIEQYFQSGTSEELKVYKESLRYIGFAVVTHNMSENTTCTIDKI